MDWIVYAFVAVAVLFIAIRVLISVRSGTFKSTKIDQRSRDFHDSNTGGGQ
jgi:hypothetical protein